MNILISNDDGINAEGIKILAEEISKITGEDKLYFYDAAAPIVSFDSIDMNIAYKKSRYDKGSADYINCPMDVDQFNAFYDALITAEVAEVHGFENEKVFEGWQSVAEIHCYLVL